MNEFLHHFLGGPPEYFINKDVSWYLALLPFASFLVVLVQCHRKFSTKRANPTTLAFDNLDTNIPPESLAKFHGGLTIFAFLVGRVVACIMLFLIASCLEFPRYDPGLLTKGFDLWIPIYYLYCILLSLAALFRTTYHDIFRSHCFVLLFAALLVDCKRNLWPLATYSESPADTDDGPLVWVRVVLLFMSAVVIPLFCPRKYIPVNPLDPADEANPEQTASIASLMVYTFLDPLMFLAARVPHLSYDQLFPLADYDYSRNTTTRAFPHLDTFQGAKKRHIFFGLMRTYRYEYTILATAIAIQVMANLASPIGIKNILHYLESGGHDATVKPWFWILWLFIGPMTMSLARQRYIFVATRMLVHTEGLLIQLVFEHSLRVRLRAETSNRPNSPNTANNAIGHDERRAKADNLIGKINNLVTTDTMNIVEARDFLMIAFFHPLQIVASVVFLYQVLGVSAFVGLAVISIMVPIPIFLATLIQKVQVHRMKKTDSRVQTIRETCNVLRMVKMFGWEEEMRGRVAQCREDEVKWLWRRRVYDFIINLLNFSIPALTMLATYGAYTVVFKQNLSAATVFSSMVVFDLLRVSLQNSFQYLSVYIEGKVSLDRLTDFLQNTELLDFLRAPSEEISDDDTVNEPPPEIIGFRDASFVWSKEGVNDPQAFVLRIDGELHFKQRGINLVIGPTGSGKTSLLMALLGEMHFLPIQPNSWFGLPREHGVAYVAQESWVQNDTIRGNILFGAPYDEERYKAVLYQCGLERDLDLFDAGDMTEVGEKGLTLSGGQKARVTLARAVYSNAQILLLDDILAALDVHTSKWIVENCLNGDLIKGRTVILVTHNIALTSDYADFIIQIGSNGTIVNQGTDIDVAISRYSKLASGTKAPDGPSKAKDTKEADEQAVSTPEGKLIVAEEIQQGHVTWKAMKLFLASTGGDHPIAFFLMFFVGLLVTHLALMSQTYVLGYWGSQYTERDPSDVNPFFYLGVYSLVLITILSCYALANLLYLHGLFRACIIIHDRLVDSILGSTFRWLDETPTSRIIMRCTQDIRAVDVPISQWVGVLAEFTIAMMTRLVAIVTLSNIFLIPAIFVAVIGAWLANFYLKAQLSVKREMSNAKAPLLAHLEAAITGLISIRAYGAQEAFKQESLKRIDFYSRISRVSYNLNRWIAVRMDVLGASFTTLLASYLVYGSTTNPVNVGFSLTISIAFCSMILWWVRLFNDLEVQANSLERIQDYLEIEQEKKPIASGLPPAAWPTSGHLVVKNLSARYSKNGPNVLHGISFEVRAGERIGVVGRTGSGKSSLMLSLLRCIVVEGDIYYDGLDTKNINLDALRSKLTIIPQMPELLSGTLRRNLDPFEQYDDLTLNAALRASGLFSLQTEEDETKLTLDSQISSGGSNLSVGQRQILALARAMVRESKLLILDEATSAIDYKTDNIIQQSLRCELGKDVTVITVAHRLQTIMDADKILVLDAGEIVEYDSPAALLAKPSGKFKSMVDGSGDREHLYSIVHRANSRG